MKVQHVETIVAIADAGSLRGAAEALGKSQPALTKTLRQVETDLGGALFHRSSRGVSLTALGERIIARCRSVTREIGRLDEEIAAMHGDQSGELHVSLSPLAAIKIMPRALALFRKTHPGIRVHLSSGLFPNALKPLRDGGVDLLIGPTPPGGTARDVSVEPLLRTPVVAVTSTASPYARARTLSDLVEAPWILIGRAQGPGDIFREAFVADGLTPPEPAFTSESYFGALSLVKHLGVACTFPLRLLEDMEKGWDIAPLELDATFPSLEISLMTRSDAPLTPAGDALVNCVRRRAASLELG